MSTATLEAPARATPVPRARGALALTLQEAFTAAVRLRANRQVATDASVFRAQIKHLLAGADHEARRLGYEPEYVKLAIYAYIALLDESALKSSQPMFSQWSGQPLMVEVFGDAIAGENFFRNLSELLSRQDSEALADVLEVYLLCLLLGFRGRYSTTDPAGVQAVIGTVQEKVRRIRGGRGVLSPAWAVPTGEVVAAARDPWIRRLGLAAAASAVVAALLYAAYRFALGSGLADLERLAGQFLR